MLSGSYANVVRLEGFPNGGMAKNIIWSGRLLDEPVDEESG